METYTKTIIIIKKNCAITLEYKIDTFKSRSSTISKIVLYKTTAEDNSEFRFSYLILYELFFFCRHILEWQINIFFFLPSTFSYMNNTFTRINVNTIKPILYKIYFNITFLAKIKIVIAVVQFI